MNYFVDHCFQFLIFAIGFCLICFSIHKLMPGLTKFIGTIISLLLNELNPKRGKTTPERINVFILLALFILALLAGVLSALNLSHILGRETGHTFHSAIICFLIVSIGSPTWLYIMDREKRVRKLTDDVLKQ
ncbi:MAG: hypothetical protein Q7K21_06430 [Elusimicrobiota bacterium]|nr:hypothetical protein [Elusimicrobiota bacterium]